MNLSTKVICIWGSGKLGHEVAELISRAGLEYQAVFDSDKTKVGMVFDNDHVICGIEKWPDFDDLNTCVVLAFGREHYNQYKNEVLKIIKNANVISYQELLNGISERIYDVTKCKWVIDYSEQIRKWLENFEEEIPCHFSDMEIYSGKVRHPRPEVSRLKEFKFVDGQTLLDIGCGGTLLYSGNINGAKLNYIPVDPLSDAYKIGHEKYNFVPNTEICFGMGEHLTRWFDESSVDFILFDNSIDHSLDPVRSIIESYRVLKKGGVLSLKHHAIEARFGLAEGLHSWDLFMSNEGSFIIAQGGTDNLINISDMFKEIAEIRTWEEKREDIDTVEVCVNIVKQKDIAGDLIDEYDNRFNDGVIIHELFKHIIMSKKTV